MEDDIYQLYDSMNSLADKMRQAATEAAEHTARIISENEVRTLERWWKAGEDR